MSKTIIPYPELQNSKKEQVALMFDNISHRYDFLNRVLSMGIDIIWRKKAVAILAKSKPKLVLDVATGTGDFAIEALNAHPDKIIGIDISAGMLEKGVEKIKRLGLQNKIELQLGDSEGLKFENNTFDAAIVAFGVRNFENLHQGLSDMCRVLKPGANCIVLEFSKPKTFPIKQLYGFYFRNVLPRVGRAISQDAKAYSYLHESVQAFPEGEAFLAAMKKAGFEKTYQKPLTFGICSIYVGVKPA